jgi:exonuclease VII small subunit
MNWVRAVGALVSSQFEKLQVRSEENESQNHAVLQGLQRMQQAQEISATTRKQRDAALTLQNQTRVFQAKNKVETIRKEKVEQKQQVVAQILHSLPRKTKAKEMATKRGERDAALTIQSQARVFQAKKKVRAIRNERGSLVKSGGIINDDDSAFRSGPKEIFALSVNSYSDELSYVDTRIKTNPKMRTLEAPIATPVKLLKFTAVHVEASTLDADDHHSHDHFLSP